MLKWKIEFFLPKDFTFVCPTEIVAFGKLARDFADHDAFVYGVSIDNECRWLRISRLCPEGRQARSGWPQPE